MRMRTWMARLALLLALVLLAAACGGEGDPPADDPTGQVATEPADAPTDAPTDDAGEPTADADAFADIEPVRLRLATLLGPGGVISGLMEWYIEELEARTGGKVTAEIAYAGSLLPGPEIMPGIQEGRAEGGLVVPAYYPNDLPLMNLIMVPVQGHNQGARPLAIQALVENHEALQAEVEAQGFKILGFTPNSTQTAALTRAVSTVEEYAGMRLRVPGIPAVGYQLIGAEPVFLSAEEVYESLQRGIVDGATFPFETVQGTGTHEVATYLVDDGLGQSGMAIFAIDLDLYESLPQSVQDLMAQLSDEWAAESDRLLTEVDEAACDAFIANGNEIIIFSDEEKQKMAERTGDAMFNKWREDAIAAGVDEATVDEVWQAYNDYVDQFTPQTSYENALEVCQARM
jgi:TRAP-type transport system periplasmic protein